MYLYITCIYYYYNVFTCTYILPVYIIMARRAIPMIAFPRARTIYIYIYSCVHLREYALYT